MLAVRVQAKHLNEARVSGTHAWDELPVAVQGAVAEHTGPVAEALPGGEGVSTAVRLILRTPSGNVFIKGTGPDSDQLQRERLDLGAVLAPHVTAISPPLLFRVQADGWDITGWPAIPGRPRADLSPGSPDIPRLAAVLGQLGTVTAPDDVPMMSAGKDWGRLDGHPDLLAGDMLVHTDPHGSNFVIDDDRVWLVDWGWAIRGPAWLTPARLVLFMMEAGWTPADAERALTTIPAWADAPPRTITAYALASLPGWEKAYRRRPGSQALRLWLHIARAWASHRASLTGTRPLDPPRIPPTQCPHTHHSHAPGRTGTIHLPPPKTLCPHAAPANMENAMTRPPRWSHSERVCHRVLAFPKVCQEAGPRFARKLQHRALTVLGVPHLATAPGQLRNFHAVTLRTCVA